jgi:hypothetical protein
MVDSYFASAVSAAMHNIFGIMVKLVDFTYSIGLFNVDIDGAFDMTILELISRTNIKHNQLLVLLKHHIHFF